MQDFDYTLTWYHGSQQELTKLRVGSSITQNKMWRKDFPTDLHCSFSLRAVRLSMTA